MTWTRYSKEKQELQEALENNHDLSHGGQIDPEDPRRWLLLIALALSLLTVEAAYGAKWNCDGTYRTTPVMRAIGLTG